MLRQKQMKEKLEYILKTIQPNSLSDIKVSEENSNNVKTFIIEASDEVKPLLIGRNGKTIKAIYNLLYPVAKREQVYNFQLKIKD